MAASKSVMPMLWRAAVRSSILYVYACGSDHKQRREAAPPAKRYHCDTAHKFGKTFCWISEPMRRKVLRLGRDLYDRR